MNGLKFCPLALIVLISACTTDTMENKEELIESVRQAEADFAARLKEAGMAAAFTEFAAPDAVISRNNRLYKGKEAIREYLSSSTLSDVRLEWAPDHIDVSESGDMAYTYGPYTFRATDPEGQPVVSEGIFHTVWRKQPDGSWKFVWD